MPILYAYHCLRRGVRALAPMSFRAACLGALALLCACSSSLTPPNDAASGEPVTTNASSSFCPIEHWGPHQTYVGERFNEQKDGSSGFWFKTRCSPKRTLLLFDGKLVHVTRAGPGITAALNADRYLMTPGTHSVALYDPATHEKLALGQFKVLPARKPVALPTPPPLVWPSVPAPMAAPLLVAHAGGGYHGMAYLNSLDALTYNYALGHRLFELDFCWTADGKLVSIHDWQGAWKKLFPDADHARVPDLKNFLHAGMIGGQIQLDLPRLRVWLAAHPDAYIVTDIRGRNVFALQRIKAVLGPQQRQIIPQMYHPDRYPDIRELGYAQIIYTLYATSRGTDALLEFIRATPLFAVTVNPSRYDADRVIAALRGTNIPVYVHTFNEVADLARFRKRGVHGLYSDFLYVGSDGRVLRQGRP